MERDGDGGQGRVRPFDVAVVGAGPAGSTTARLLAERGARVVLLERARLPRDKLCGGGLTGKAVALCPARALATIERRVERLELRAMRVGRFEIAEPRATVAMVERRAFDMALVEAAADQGVDVRASQHVRAVEMGDSGTRLQGATRHGVQAAVVVVADGEPSAVSRMVGLASPPWRRALALEVDLPISPAIGTDRAVVAYVVPGGYAWYFPKAGHASVGVLSVRASRFPMLRGDLVDFAAELSLHVPRDRARGHWIPLGLRSGSVATRRALLVGDAAGTADPLFGEGISFALASAHLAAGAIGRMLKGSSPGLLSYDSDIRAGLGPRMRRLALAARLADLTVALPLAAIRASAHVRRLIAGAVAEFGPGLDHLALVSGAER